MKFFTAELYGRVNSADEHVAQAACKEWEVALAAYAIEQAKTFAAFPEIAAEFISKVCFHDAEVVAHEFAAPPPPSQYHVNGGMFYSFFLRDENFFYAVNCLLRRPAQTRQVEAAVFQAGHAGSGLFWLYDEFITENDGKGGQALYHNILLSDGREITLPLTNIKFNTFPQFPPARRPA